MNTVPLAGARLSVAALLASALFAQTLANDPEERGIEVPSPDEKFVFQKLKRNDDENVFGVVERATRKQLSIEGNTLQPMEDAIQALWSPNSKRLAVNARLGGRYESAELFEWTGKKFKQIGNLEGLLSPVGHAEIARQSKAEALPKDIYLRRIWDTFEVRRWIDNDTLEARGYTHRTFIRNEPDGDPEGIASDFLFTVKIDKKGRLKIVSKKPTPPETDEETAPEANAAEGQSNEPATPSEEKPAP
jgi:hypothetical protein